MDTATKGEMRKLADRVWYTRQTRRVAAGIVAAPDVEEAARVRAAKLEAEYGGAQALLVDGETFVAAKQRLDDIYVGSGMPSGALDVQHINGDTLDNRAANLRWTNGLDQ